MIYKERTYSVLIVSYGEKFNTVLKSLLPVTDYGPVKTVSSVAAGKRALDEREYDLVIINSPLPDEFGRRFAIDVSSSRNMACLMFVKSELHEEIKAKVMDHGVYTIPKPTSSVQISQALAWLCVTRERLRVLDKKTSSIEDKMSEIRIVNRAKWLLIEKENMTEAEAHRFIEKSAMDNCTSKKEISERIIKKYS